MASLSLVYWSFVLFPVFLVVAKAIRVARRLNLRHIPGPFISKVSNLWNLKAAASGELQVRVSALHQKYGPVVRTGLATVDISDPEAIPMIYGIQSNFIKSDFYTVFSGKFKGHKLHDLFSTRDPNIHKVQKRNASNAYAMSSMLGLESLVDESSQILMQKLKLMEDGPIDLGSWLQWYAFDVVGQITFSKPFGFMDQGKDVNGMISQIDNGLYYSAIVGQYPSLHRHLLLGNATVEWIFSKIPSFAAKNPLRFIFAFAEQHLSRHEKEAEYEQSLTKDFLSRLREQQKIHPDRFSELDVLTGCITNLLAGSDTTAISLRAVIYYLIKNPSCYQALQKEIDDFDAQGKLSPNIKFHESLNMPYLQAAMKEAMRMHPGVGFPLERIVPKGGCTISGVFIPEGTIVGMNAWVLHRDRTVFGEDADRFRPERWLEADEEKLKVMNRTFLSFGHGTRSCIGKNISILEMSKVVPQMMRHYNITMAKPDQEWKMENYWFVRQSGLECRIHRRNLVAK